MSREILFRGKRMDNGKWTCGDRVYFANQPKPCIYYCRENYTLITAVHPETISQFIGLYDANGNWLFEGDIIKGNQGSAYVIEYGEGIAGYLARAAEESTWTPSMNAGTMKNYRIIGNRWDNPELMGKED